MSSLKRKIDVMKSPTSLIRFRNAVGVMLALSAIFAVVLSTISLPSDNADAQEADENVMAIAERAEAWWNSLNNVEMVNALRGYEADHAPNVDGRQLGDPTRTNILTGTNYDENGNVVTDGTGTAGVPYSNVETAQRMYADLEATDSETVRNLVDGAVNNNDIYAVGEHEDDINQAIRGWQSVELWWRYVDCAEARIAVGEDNGAILTTPYNDPYTTDDDADPPTESSAVCEVVGDPAAVQVIAYGPACPPKHKTQVDEVGQALLGLDAPGSADMTADNARAKAWWNKLR